MFAVVVFLGVAATALTDAWALLRRRVFGLAAPDWALVGRWFAHLARGRFRHARIADAAPVRGERALGWCAHYAVGIGFAALFVALAGRAWLLQPMLAPALGFGVVTVAAPFLLLQPGIGAGVAAARTPRPWRARMQSLLTHAVFGFGLYLAALAAAPVFPID